MKTFLIALLINSASTSIVVGNEKQLEKAVKKNLK